MADVMSDVGFVGAVVEPIDDERSKLFGACFAVLDPRLMMTADHVVEGALERGATRLHVLGPGLAPVPVISFLRDPVADVAVLVVERSDVHPFREFGEVEVGAAVSLFAASAQQLLHTSVTGREHLVVESSARSRGTDPVPPCARTNTYRYDALALDCAPAKGFSGSPVWTDDGALVGLYCVIRRRGSVTEGFALEITAAGRLLDAAISQLLPEGCPA